MSLRTFRCNLTSLSLIGCLMAAPLAAQPPAGPPEPDVPGRAPNEPRYLGGMWNSERFFYEVKDTPKLPATKAKDDGYRAAMAKGQIIYTAWTSCRPGAISAMSMVMNSLMVMQSPTEITLMFEEPRLVRRIRLNASHPAKLEPSYLGDSVGHWEGNTLVVDTIGFNGNFEIDTYALPTSKKLHTVERISKSADGKRVDIEVVVDDPEHYSAPFTLHRGWKVSSARHQLEYDCMENPREEEFAHTYFVKDLYRPTCIRFEGKGMELSKIVCRKPDDSHDPEARR